jgi:ubiquinone/menaquinone biosynthesis C-methylase UbiE
LVKLDIGCGPHPKEGYEGVDQYAFDGKVKHVMNVCETPWPWKDGEVEEINCSHFLEHLTAEERIAFLNECYRVLKPDGKVFITTPHWASNRAYGDPTHQWPPISEMFFYYLDRKWRTENAPHTDVKHWPEGYACDFLATWGYSMHQAIVPRNQEYQQYALAWFKEAAQDTIATLIARKGA